MIEFFSNILEIICSLSHSNTGYLVKFDLIRPAIIASFGANLESCESFNNLLFNKVVSGDIKKISSHSIPNLKKVLNNFPWKSHFFKELYTSKKNNEQAIYLVLFSEKARNYTEANFLKIKPILQILKERIEGGIDELPKLVQEKDKVFDHSDYLRKYASELFEILIEVSQGLIFILDGSGNFVALNESGSSSLDYTANELTGRHFLELVSAKEKASVSAAFQKIIEDNKTVTFETSLISKYGNEVIFEISGSSLIENKEVAGVLAVGKNITELRLYEEKIDELNARLTEAERIIAIEKQRSKRQKAMLFELNKMKSEFVSNVSHELRTPLASIIGFSETIASDDEMPAETRMEFNEIILNEGKRLAKLINDILDVSKIENGEIELNLAGAGIVEILNEAIELNRKIINDKEIIFTSELPDEEIILKVDKELLFKSIYNVINNAVKFTGKKGRVHVGGQSLYKEFEIIVSDTGVGIPENDLPNIFQKFYRVSRPGTEIPGTGLGLVFVKQIVDLHKGFITVQSEINKGTTVIIKLPRDSRI